jgi:hypothetical protein
VNPRDLARVVRFLEAVESSPLYGLLEPHFIEALRRGYTGTQLAFGVPEEGFDGLLNVVLAHVAEAHVRRVA